MSANFHRARLPGGLRVLGVPRPDRRSFLLSVYVGVGSRQEPPEQEGLSHFLEHMLFQGSSRFRDAVRLCAHAESLGGSINAMTMPEYTCYYVSAHRRHWRGVVDILADMLTTPSLRADRVERERRVILQEMRQSMDDHGRNFNVDDLAYNLLWREPRAREASPVGDERRISRFDRRALRDHYRRHYRAGRTVVAASGAFPWKELCARVGRRFRALPAGEGEPTAPQPAAPQRGARVLFRRADWPTVSVKLCHRAFAEHDPRYAAALLLDEVLGGGSSSRLFARVREECGLVYEISSETVTFSDVGSLDIYTSVEAGHLVDTVREILRVVRRLRDRGVGSQEFRRARDRLVCDTDMMEDDPYALADQYARHALLGRGPVERPSDLARRIGRVRRGDVARVARDILRPAGRCLAIVGPFTRTHRKRVERLLRREG